MAVCKTHRKFDINNILRGDPATIKWKFNCSTDIKDDKELALIAIKSAPLLTYKFHKD